MTTAVDEIVTAINLYQQRTLKRLLWFSVIFFLCNISHQVLNDPIDVPTNC